MTTSNHRLKPLTPHQEAEARGPAYQAYLKEMETRFPKPKPAMRDLVHDNPVINKALVRAISTMPAFLMLILVSSMIISADKTYAAFSGVAANDGWFWTQTIGILGVVMTEGSMVYVAFAATRQRLQHGLERRVITLPAILQGFKVRLGLAPVPDYDQMPDTSLQRYSKLVFALVLCANVFTAAMPVLETSLASMAMLDLLKLGFAVFMGVVAPFALHSVGSQLAHLSYDLYRQENDRIKSELEAAWRAEIDRRWTEEAEERTRWALHRKFLVENKLALDAGSPYLLLGNGQEGAVETVPFDHSPTLW